MNQTMKSWLERIDVAGLASGYAKATPTHFFTISDFLPADFAREVATCYPDFAHAIEEAESGAGKRFDRVNEDVKVQITDSTHFAEPVQRLNELLASDEFVGMLEQISGIEGLLPDPDLAGAGMHIMGPSGNLGVHLDFNYLRAKKLHRRLNLLVYLTPNWQPTWGGEFELWDPDVKERLEVIEPRFNSCAAFNTTTESFHGVREIRCPDGVTRNTFAVFYYTAEPPSEFDGRTFSTIYRARPGEWWKRFVQMPLDRLQRMPHRMRIRLRRALRG